MRGVTLFPIYKLVPQVAKKDKILYELLVLVDSIRDGRAREQDMEKKTID